MYNYTNEYIQMYINKELTTSEIVDFENAILNDTKLYENYLKQLITDTDLEKPLVKVSKRTIDFIVDYARESVAEKV